MEHVIRTNQMVTDLFFAIVEEYADQRQKSTDNCVDSYLHCLVAQMYVKAEEASIALRASRDRMCYSSKAHSSPFPKTLPCEIEEFMRLCRATKRQILEARCLLSQASVAELATRNPFYNSRSELPATEDVMVYLLVLMPTAILINLVNWKPAAETSRMVIKRASKRGEPGGFLFNELFPNRMLAHASRDYVG